MRLATDIGITTDYGRRMTGRSTPPVPGTGVIVEDRSGARYLRLFRLGLGDHWTAAVRNPNYPALDSERDGLRIVAVAENRLLDGLL
jgi:hypothetical protein